MIFLLWADRGADRENLAAKKAAEETARQAYVQEVRQRDEEYLRQLELQKQQRTGQGTQVVQPQPSQAKEKEEGKVCALYYRAADSRKFVQGIWTDNPAYTDSVVSCWEYMKKNVVEKPNCGQPNGEYINIFLIDKSKHTYDMPASINMQTEYVYGGFCPK